MIQKSSAALIISFLALLALTNQLSLSPYSVQHSKTVVGYASVAYCDNTCLTSWSCKSGSHLPGLTNVTYLSQSITQAEGYLGYSPSENTIVISFRGSANIPNWI